MQKMTAKELLALYARGEGMKSEMLSLWDELAEYIQPGRAGFSGPRSDGEKRTNKLNDGTAPQANDDLAHYLAAAMTPAAAPWLQLAFRDGTVENTDAFNEWLEECGKITSAALLRSNFYEAMAEVYSDLPVFGLATLQCDERKDLLGAFDGLNWEAVWLRELVFLPNQYGDIDVSFRCWKQSALQWHQMFGEKAGKLITDLVASKPETAVDVLHAVYPRNAEDIDRAGMEKGAVEPLKMPYASVWIVKADGHIARESGYMELARYTARWARMSGSPWANSPGLLALPDIRTLNEAKRLEMAAWERTIDRPMKSNQNNIEGNLNIDPKGLTICRDINGLAPLYDATDFNLTAIQVEQLRTSILRTFFADLIREPGDVSTAKTAYEVAKRLERAQRILGESVGHLRGMLRWAAERAFKILYRNGQFPPAPPGLLESGAVIDVRYTSPLQVAQQAQGVEQTMLWLGDMGQIAQFNPEVLDWFDVDGWAEQQSKARAVPAYAVRDQAQVDEVRAARREREAAAARQQAALATGQVVRDVGAGAGPDAAAGVLGALSG